MYNEDFNVGERPSHNLIIPTTSKFIVYYYRGRDESRRIEQRELKSKSKKGKENWKNDEACGPDKGWMNN